MKKLVLILLTATSLSVYAQPPAAAKDKHLESVTSLTEEGLIMELFHAQLDDALAKLTEALKVKGAEEQALVAEHRSKMVEEMINEVRQDKYRSQLKALYADKFSDKQLQEIGAFLGTETGQEFLTNLPEIFKSAYGNIQKAGTDFDPKLGKMARILVLEIQKLRGEDITAETSAK